MSIFRSATISIVIAIFMAGCKPHTTEDGVNGPNHPDSSPGATFFVYDADGEGRVGDVVSNSKWPVPLTANFSFNACMNERASNQHARGHKFEIENPETGQRIFPDGPSNKLGCITWQEPIPFNYYAKRSAPIQIVRHIVGAGVHTGYFSVAFAIDPWAIGDEPRDMKIPAVQYLRKVSPPPHLVTDREAVAKTLGGDESGADLWISKLDFNLLDRQDFDKFSKVEFQIKLNPFVQWVNNDGMPGFKKLESGKFKISAHLVATDAGAKQDQKVILNTSVLTTDAEVKNGELLATLSTDLARSIPIGNVVLVVKLEPEDLGGARSLQVFEGIYELGDIHKMSDAQLAQSCVDRTSACNFDTFIQGANNFDALKSKGYAFDNDRFSFSNVKLRFVTVAPTPAETATQRTVSYSVTTCVTDRRTGTRVLKTPFHIEYVDDDGKRVDASDTYQAQDLMTDDEGCLHWLAHVWHQYYEAEHFIKKRVHVTMGGTSAGAMLRFVLNPWDDKFTFGFDEKELTAKFIDDNSDPKKKQPSRFFTGGYGYHTIRFLYSFDEYMSLQVKKTILLEVDPRVLRYSGIVNARKTTEGLRDGIYMLRVAIQKDYLDATTAGVKILGEPKDPDHIQATMVPSRRDPKSKEIRRRSYVSTATQLVRVVDGRLIKPVELTMVDLRLMRMRTNFLIELETVDEQLVSANRAFQEEYKKEIQDYRDTFRTGKENEELSEVERQEKYNERAKDTQKKLKEAWDQLTKMLAQKKNDPFEEAKPGDYKIPDELWEPIVKVLGVNNFTETKLPSCDDTDCDRFVEENAGLKPRTFVGPMIFLSNSYSDAVRPTDNLDEACERPDNPYDHPGLLRTDNPYKKEEEDWFGKREAAESQTRRNMLYNYSAYYGSMSRLCNISVEDLIEEEIKQKKDFIEVMTSLKTLENYVAASNSDFAIVNEKSAGEYKSTENVLTSDRVLQLLNDRLYAKSPDGPTLPQWTANDLAPLFLGKEEFDIEKERSLQMSGAQLIGLCNILSNRLTEQLTKFHPDYSSNAFSNFWSKRFGRNAPFAAPGVFANEIFHRCVDRGPASIFVDSRLWVSETGNDYRFKGGLQLNLNVGESFSVSESQSYSKSFDAVDVTTSLVGLGALIFSRGVVSTGAVGAVMIHLLRPFSYKGSDSLSDGNGTSISSQTYLVTQIAKFDVELKKYELCRTFRFDKSILDSSLWIDYGWIDPSFSDEEGRTLGQVVDRGITVCSGEPIPKSIRVPEDYFYFTQHFTEGDMLDEADLLNNPWLLQLRGDRDFATFVTAIKAKQAVNPNGLGYGIGRNPYLRELDWPLEQLAKTYSQTAPSHPGFYAISPPLITKFPMNDQTINLKNDINRELCSREGGCDDLPIQSSPPNSHSGEQN